MIYGEVRVVKRERKCEQKPASDGVLYLRKVLSPAIET